jgi:hypothetical protein
MEKEAQFEVTISTVRLKLTEQESCFSIFQSEL